MSATARLPRFTVVVPTHNRADVLPVAIASVLAQTEPDFELIVAGDGCTDTTDEVVASFADPRVRWLPCSKAPGIGYAVRNAAIRATNGRYIAYLAHDDLWFPDHLERIGAMLDEPGAVFAMSRLLSIDLEGRLRPAAFNLSIASHAAGLWRGHSAITMSSVAHTRACLDQYGMWDESLAAGGDIELWHRILTGAGMHAARFVSEPTSIHFVASWRNTREQAARDVVANWLVRRWLERQSPAALRIPVERGVPQQETVWRALERDPRRVVGDIRSASVAFADTLLWPARSVGGLVGLRAGLVCARGLDGLWQILDRLMRRRHRRQIDALKARTAPRELGAPVRQVAPEGTSE